MRILVSFIIGLVSVSLMAQQQPTKVWTLEDCVNYAVSNNLSVKSSEYNVALQETQLEDSKNQLLPSASGSASLGYNFGKPNVHDSFNNSLGVSAGVTLYNGNRTKYNIQSATNQLEIAHLNTEQIKSNLAVQIVNAYLNVLYNREGVKLAKDQVKISQQLLDGINELVNAGVKARNDLFQAEANLATNEEGLVSAENNLEIALLQLAQILQIPYENFEVADVSLNIDEATLKYSNSQMIYDKALTWRPEILIADKQIEDTDVQILSAKSGHLPVVSASYNFSTGYFLDVESSLKQPGYFEQLKNGRGHGLGVSLSVPIFDRFSTKLNTQRANIRRHIAENDLENQRIALRSEIDKAYIDAKTSLKTFEATKKTVEAQQEAFRTAEERYNLGVMTSYNFEQVRNQLVQAQSSYIRAKYNYIFKIKFLEIYYGLPVTLD